MAVDSETHPCPFEGPEKLLEIWFAPTAEHVHEAYIASRPQGVDTEVLKNGKYGLRAVERKIWDEVLDIVKCQVLSVMYGTEVDAYLLSESSLFVAPHRLILKTCGTTLNLLGLPRILDIAATYSDPPLLNVYRCFYSRKAFMFPERQLGPHREWGMEVQFLDDIFKKNGGCAYTVGRVNGDHWLLYLSNPDPELEGPSVEYTSASASCTELSSLASSLYGKLSVTDARPDTDADVAAVAARNSLQPGLGTYLLPALPPTQGDYTIEILMTHLSARSRAAFFTPSSVSCDDHQPATANDTETPGSYAQKLSEKLGINKIFPPKHTTLDAYSFTPCGYSSNALIKWSDDEGEKGGEGYYTIHVTPEEGWSYASFECNVPLSTDRHRKDKTGGKDEEIPDLHTLIERVVRIFEPGKLTLTLFVSSDEAGASDGDGEDADDDEGNTECAVDAAQRVFKTALTRPVRLRKAKQDIETPASENNNVEVDRLVYKRTDKINYEFRGYELAFASFELL